MDYGELMTYTGDIYLGQIFEPQDNTLILEIYRGKVSDTEEDIQVGDHVLRNTRSIDLDKTLPTVRLEFDWYIAYSVTNESYGFWDDYEMFNGSTFRVYSKSRYLDFIKVGTIATENYPGPFKHYGIVALNHVIDVVSTTPPIITLIDGTV